MFYKAEVEGATLNRVGRANEDNLVVDRLIQGISGASRFSFKTVLDLKSPHVLAVLDGAGGTADGGAASELAARVFSEETAALATLTEEALLAALDKTNQAVVELFAQGEIGASTLSAVVLQEASATVAYLGDSPVFLLREGVLQQLTVPHTEATLRGLAVTGDKSDPTENCLVRYLGHRRYSGREQVELLRLDLCRGDLLLLCSDGIEKGLSPEKVQKILQKKNPAEELVRMAYRQAEKKNCLDDTTALVIRMI